MRAITTSAVRTIASFASACAVITLVVVGVQAAQAAGPQTTTASLTAADDPAPGTDDATAGAAADGARKQLRADLGAARALTGDERRSALAEIRANARAGKYGDAIERRFDRRAERRQIVRALLPDELKADLKAVREAPADQRAALRQQVRDDALAGKYGEQVAAVAEKLHELRSR